MTHHYGSRDDRGYMSTVSEWMPSADRLMHQARQRPEAFLVIAAGLALLLRGNRRRVEVYRSGQYPRGYSSSRSSGYESGSSLEDRRRHMDRADQDAMSSWASSGGEAGRRGGDMMQDARDSARGAMEQTRERARDAGERMTNYASDIAGQISGTASEYANSASRWADEAREQWSERSSHLAQQARSLPGELDDAVRDHPLVLAALGVAVGAAIGASLPATDIENRAMGDARHSLGDVARNAGGRLTEAAEEALEEAKRQAEQHGISADGMKGMARDVAGAFASAATGSGSGEQGKPGSSQAGSQAGSQAASHGGSLGSPSGTGSSGGTPGGVSQGAGSGAGSPSGFAQPAPLSTGSAGSPSSTGTSSGGAQNAPRRGPGESGKV